MKYLLIPVLVVIAGMMTSCNREKTPEWKPAENPIFTVWGEKMDPSAPWPEYPRPALARDEWMNLNGLWDYAICPKDSDRPEPQGKILVPFPVESALSGVRERMSDSLALWYSREFVLPKQWKDKRIIINFEASDWDTTVWVNDRMASMHRGGYDPSGVTSPIILMTERSIHLWLR